MIGRGHIWVDMLSGQKEISQYIAHLNERMYRFEDLYSSETNQTGKAPLIQCHRHHHKVLVLTYLMVCGS